jgi:hypothetical protein
MFGAPCACSLAIADAMVDRTYWHIQAYDVATLCFRGTNVVLNFRLATYAPILDLMAQLEPVCITILPSCSAFRVQTPMLWRMQRRRQVKHARPCLCLCSTIMLLYQ